MKQGSLASSNICFRSYYNSLFSCQAKNPKIPQAGEEKIILIKEKFDKFFFINPRNIYEACRLPVNILRIHKSFLSALDVLYKDDRLFTLAVQFN